MDEQALADWAAALAAELGIDQSLDVDRVLDLASDAAHAIMRPAAPLTTHLVGIAIGQAGGDPVRIADILDRTHALMADQPGPTSQS